MPCPDEALGKKATKDLNEGKKSQIKAIFFITQNRQPVARDQCDIPSVAETTLHVACAITILCPFFFFFLCPHHYYFLILFGSITSICCKIKIIMLAIAAPQSGCLHGGVAAKQ